MLSRRLVLQRRDGRQARDGHGIRQILDPSGIRQIPDPHGIRQILDPRGIRHDIKRRHPKATQLAAQSACARPCPLALHRTKAAP